MPQLVERYFVVPHTHWDREWYRPFEHFRLMLGSVVDEVLDTLERDPEFTSFTLDGQAIVLEDYVSVRPGNEPRLRALIESGRIEIGPSYVLPDEFLVAGESLVRNLLIGRAVCSGFGGRASAAGYLPDSFGHPLQLPQILAGFGIESFLFSRGLGDQIDDVGVVFRWVAPDGSEVLALQLLGDYGNFAGVADADDAERRVRGLLERFGPALGRAGTRQVVLCNGTDHVRIQPQMPALCAELERRFPGSAFSIARYGDYVAELSTGELPAYSGELVGSRLWNILRGVNSSRLYLKQANEEAEQRLLGVETLASLCALRSGAEFPLADFTFAWKELLKCQPHDSICGCSCDEVHRDMLGRYESLHRTLDLLSSTALSGAFEERGAGELGLFNQLPFARSGLMRVEGFEPVLVDLDGFSAQTVELVGAAPHTPRVGDAIESDTFRVQAAADGTIAIEDLRRGVRFDGLHRIEHELDMGDLYNFCPVAGVGLRRFAATGTRILRDSPICSELEISYRGDVPAGLDTEARPLSGVVELSIRTVVRLVRGSGRVEFETTLDNAARDHRLRVCFPVREVAGPIRAEGQFAVVERPLAPPAPRVAWCEPPDPTSHMVGAVALGPVALLTRGLPEYEARAAGAGAELCLTMLRCVGMISRATDEIPARPLGAGPRLATPEGQCLGRHVLHYALRLDADSLDDGALLRAGQDYRAPLMVVPAGVEFAAPVSLAGNIVFSCLKGAENGDGLIMRVFNPAAQGSVASVLGPVAVERVRLDESGGDPLPDASVELRPGEIVSLRLRVAKRS